MEEIPKITFDCLLKDNEFEYTANAWFDGKDYHGRGGTPAKAIYELSLYWMANRQSP